MLKYGIKRESIEQKVKFMNGLKSERKSIVSTIKAYEQFRNYSLAKMVGILRSHETKVLEEVKYVPNVGPLAFVVKFDGSKGKKSEVFKDDSELDGINDKFTSEIKALMVSNPNNFFKIFFSIQG